MRIITLFSLLSTSIMSTFADPVCIQAILSTIPYKAALTTHNGACPSATPGAYDLASNGAGCCPSNVRIRTLGKLGAACCPCGALCTGFFPDMLDWNESAGKFYDVGIDSSNAGIDGTNTQA
jgi:hypothetical protein